VKNSLVKWGAIIGTILSALLLTNSRALADEACYEQSADAVAESAMCVAEVAACSEGDIAACFSAPAECSAAVESVSESYDTCSNDSADNSSADNSSTDDSSRDGGSSDSNE